MCHSAWQRFLIHTLQMLLQSQSSFHGRKILIFRVVQGLLLADVPVPVSCPTPVSLPMPLPMPIEIPVTSPVPKLTTNSPKSSIACEVGKNSSLSNLPFSPIRPPVIYPVSPSVLPQSRSLLDLSVSSSKSPRSHMLSLTSPPAPISLSVTAPAFVPVGPSTVVLSTYITCCHPNDTISFLPAPAPSRSSRCIDQNCSSSVCCL